MSGAVTAVAIAGAAASIYSSNKQAKAQASAQKAQQAAQRQQMQLQREQMAAQQEQFAAQQTLAQQQFESQKAATARAEQAAKDQAAKQERELKKASQKAPDVGDLLTGNAQREGMAGTMLTGPSGVDESSLTLGRSTLLGG
ncbi:hypothetical protein [Pseudothauera rhizosphaerae]|uniref:Uncharacterized protein n=1 Tax=Pseudothauera rhizosphaerae TaxID=2565932 RepID=A0A4S4AWB0_9RHOO|nr:hypothetical protein [Pseudothauera rhizosphaerae]THF64324.1 hypothetical protein E6O51_03160 [Pseudothauera rhizosphaerae]